MKMLAVATMVSLSALSMVACSSEVEGVKIESDKQATGIGEYKGDKEVSQNTSMGQETNEYK